MAEWKHGSSDARFEAEKKQWENSSPDSTIIRIYRSMRLRIMQKPLNRKTESEILAFCKGI